MKRSLSLCLTALLLLASVLCRAQSNYSTTYTSNVTLSIEGGNNASTCKVVVNDVQYDGIKAGTSSKAGAWKVTVPAGTAYLHMHVAAWKNENVTLTASPSGLVEDLPLTNNEGISNNSPFTFSGDPSSSDYYKVISFTNLTQDVDITFTATGGKRFVVFGVNSETGGSPAQTVATPTFSPAAGTYTEAQSVSISCTTSGATIHYTLDGTVPTTSSAIYSMPINVTTTTTVKAIAVKSGMNNSSVATAAYNFPTIYPNIAAWKADHTATSSVVSGIAGDVTAIYQNGNYLYVQDATAALLVYGNVGKTYENGDVISGGIFGTASLYNGTMEFIPTQTFADGVAGTAVQPTVVTAATIDTDFDTYTGRLVKIEGITFDSDHTFAINNTAGRTTTFTHNSTTLTCFDSFKVLAGLEVTEGQNADIIGLVGCHNTTKQIFPRSTGDIIVQSAPTYYNVSIATGIENGSVEASPTSATEGQTITVTATPNSGFELATLTYTFGATTNNISQETMQFAMPADNVTINATFTEMSTVATPTFSLEEGTYVGELSVTIACATEGATIHYTTDGTDPTAESPVYSQAIAVSATTTLKAFAVKSGMNNSPVASVTYTIVQPAQPKDYTLITNYNALIAGDKYIIVGIKDESYKALGKQNSNNRAAVDVTPSANVINIAPAAISNSDAVFEFTLGQENGHWTLYDAINGGYLYAASSSANYLRTQPTNDANGEWTIEIASGGVATIKAQGDNSRNWLRLNNNGNLFSCYGSGQLDVYLYKAGDVPQANPQLTVSATQLSGFNYTSGNGPSATQSFSISGNDLSDNITITAPTNFEICLTADGTFANSLELTPSAGVLSTTTIYVRMVEGLSANNYTGNLTATSGSTNATVALSGAVTALPIAATPTFSLAEGNYLLEQTVSISCETEGATIHYTLDGTEPTESSAVYSTPITINTTTTLKAIAIADNHSNSAVAEVTYTIHEAVSIAEARALADNEYTCVEGVVVFIDGRNVHIQDETAGIDLYLTANAPSSLAIGDKVRSYGKKTTYNHLVELSGINASNENVFVVVSTGNTLPAPTVWTIAEINSDFDGDNLIQSTRVTIEAATIGAINTSGNTTLNQGSDNLVVYRIPNVPGMIQGDLVTLTGIVSCYNGNLQLRVVSADDIVYTHRPVLTSNVNSLTGFTYDYDDGGPSEAQNFLIGGNYLTDNVAVYPSDHFEVSSISPVDFHVEAPAMIYIPISGYFHDISIYVRLKANLEPGTYEEQIYAVSEGADTLFINVTGTVTGGTPTPPDPPTPPTPGDGNYVRISDLSQLTDGSPVVFAARFDNNATNYYAMTNASSGKPTGMLFTSTTSEGNEILPASIVDEESSYYWIVGVTDNGYTFTNALGELIGYSSSTNFSTGGDNTEWSIESGTSVETAMVPNYTGFVITNVNNDGRAFALNTSYNFGPYAKSNMSNNNAGSYNFFLDLFVKTEGGITPPTPVVATPTFTPAAGTYYEAQTVGMACTTEGATIHYTIDGTDPTESSPVYSTPLTVEATTTIKAIAMKEGYDDSNIAEATYVIQLGVATIFNQDWEGEMNGWTFVNVEGDDLWNIQQYSNNHYACANGYNHGANEDWCISPAFNLNAYSNPVLSFRTATKFDGNVLQVFFSNDYDGVDPATATWTALACALSTGNYNWVESGDISLSSFSGTNCYIGFKYTCEESQAAAWEVDDILLVGQTSMPVVTVTPLSLAGFSYIEGEGPSTEQSFTVSGLNLSGNVVVTEAEDFEISLVSGNGFVAQSALTLSQSGGNLEETTIYVRMKAGLEVGEYNNETITVACAEVEDIEVACSGTVTAQPEPGGDYVRITDASELVAGNRVILAARYNETANAYRAAANTLDNGKLGTTEFVSQMNGADETIPASIMANEDSYYWTVGITANGYTFTNAAGQTISYNSSANFNFTGSKTEWTIGTGTSNEASLVPNYFGFNIVNVDTDNRAFALRVTETNSVVGAYSTTNMSGSNAGEYNFFLDIFQQGEGGTPTVAAPVFSPAGGTYFEPQEVSITCPTEGATIYYSLESESGTWYEYEETLTVDESTTIWAYASKEGYNDSPVASVEYNIQTDLVIIFNQDWESDWNGWTQVSVAGDSTWRISQHNGNHYAYMNAYQDVANEDWLISPAFNLNDYSDVVLTFRSARNYNGPDIEVYFTDDYDGQDPTAATWQSLECTLASSNGWNWAESGEINLNDYSGTSCNVAFKYTSTDGNAAGWEVDDIMLVSGSAIATPSITATPNSINSFNYIENHGPSNSYSYTLTASNLEGQGDITVLVTEGFEISLDDEAFSEQLEIAFAEGQIVGQPLTVYVRMAEGLAMGSYEGAIMHEGGEAYAEVSLSGVVYSEYEPTIEAFMPLYIQGNNGSNNNRVPVATAVYISNLEPNTIYRYTNQFVDDNDGPETAGAGNVIYANPEGFYRSTSPSLATEGGYGEFTTDEDGEAFAWFMNEPTANARFTPGNHVYLRIRINDGHDGTTVANIFTTEDYATVLNFGTEYGEYQGSAFYAKSEEAPMSFAMLFATYDDWRPVYSTSIETTGVEYGSINQYADFYKDEVAGKDGWFGGILPNDNENGINIIWILDMESYVINDFYAENGEWHPEAHTINPTNGLSEPIFIDLTYDGVDDNIETNIKVWSADHEFVVENGDNAQYTMTVYNLLGQPMMQRLVNASSTQHFSHSLAKGLYVISLQNSQNKVATKVIVK